MTHERLLERWHKELEGNKWVEDVLPSFDDYLAGQTDRLPDFPAAPVLSGCSYPAWLVAELDGSEPEAARRMLWTFSKLRAEGLIRGAYHSLEKEAEVCYRIGYGFDEVREALFACRERYPTLQIYRLAELAVRYAPEAACAYADLMLNHVVVSGRKTELFYYAVYIAALLLRLDRAEYAGMLPPLVALSSGYQDVYVVAMLYKAYDLSPVLRERLAEGVRASVDVARALKSLVADARRFRSLLAELGAEGWSYYYLVAEREFLSADVPAELVRLYRADEPLFMETYRHLKEDGAMGQYFLLSLLLRDGKSDEPWSVLNQLSAELALDFLKQWIHRSYPTGDLTTARLEDSMTPKEDWREWLGCIFHIYGDIRPLEILSLFYDRVPNARIMLDHLLLKPVDGYRVAVTYYMIDTFLRTRKAWLGTPYRESLQLLLDGQNDLTMREALRACACRLLWCCDESGRMFMEEDVRQHEQMALDILTKEKLEEIAYTLDWMGYLFGPYGCKRYGALVRMLNHQAKAVRKMAEKLLEASGGECYDLLRRGLKLMEGDSRNIAKRLLKQWAGERKEGAGFRLTAKTVVRFCEDNQDPECRKHVSWIPAEMLEGIRLADSGGTVPAGVMQYVLSEYMAQDEPRRLPVCDKVVNLLCRADVQAALEKIFCLWLGNRAEAKRKLFLVPYCLYASDEQILRLGQRLKEWTDNQRVKLAAFAVNAIAMNGRCAALMMLARLSETCPNARLREAARGSFAFAAEALEVPEEVFADKMVPDFGLSPEGEKVLDYGPRSFTVRLQPDFSFSVYDDTSRKQVRILPMPAHTDEMKKAYAVRKDFLEMKKQVKSISAKQSARLEQVLVNGRTWTAGDWKDIFADNPLMRLYAVSLIWGVYRDGKLVDSFRYRKDGTLLTPYAEIYTLPEGAAISLVHPAELLRKTQLYWKRQLEADGIAQSLPQLSAPVALPGEGEVAGNSIVRYNGTRVPAGKVLALAKQYGWLRGESRVAGTCTCYHWVEPYLQVAVRIDFELVPAGEGQGEEILLKDLLGYRLDESGRIDDCPDGTRQLHPDDLPRRFVSSVLVAMDGLRE